MPLRSIKQEGGGGTPISGLRVELLDEVLHEQHHDIAIRVCLRQRVVHLAIIVKSRDQGDPGSNRLGGHRGWRRGRTPHHASEVRLVQP